MAISTPINLELSLTGSNYTQVRLDWVEPSSNPALVTGYYIENSADNIVWTDLITNTNSKLTYYTDHTTINGTRRYYRVKALYPNETSQPSNTEFINVPALPETVTNVFITVLSDSELTIEWRYTLDSNFSYYEIRQTANIHDITTYRTITESINLSNLTPHTLYKYEVRVKSKYGYSEWTTLESIRTHRVHHAPVLNNKNAYLKNNTELTWTAPLKFNPLFKCSITVGNSGTTYGYSLSESIGSINQSITIPAFLFANNSAQLLTDFTIDGTVLNINAGSHAITADLSDYYFRLVTGDTILDTFNTADETQEFTLDSDSSSLKLNSYNGGFDITAYLNARLDLYIYDINPDLTDNENIPEIINYQIEGSYNNINWHILRPDVLEISYDVYHPNLINIRVAARNSVGLGELSI